MTSCHSGPSNCADGVNSLPEAEDKNKKFTELGYGKLPICMAKTHLSLSADPTLKGRPKGFTITVRDMGILVIRNIAMCFDAHLPAESAKPVFSKTI